MRALYSVVMTAALAAAGCRGAQANYPEPPESTYSVGTYQVKIGDVVATVPGAAVTQKFFSAIGIPPLLGRFFVEGESSPATSNVMALSYSLWKERFDGSPAIIGRIIEVDGRSRTVVGIAPEGFSVPKGAQVWVPKIK